MNLDGILNVKNNLEIQIDPPIPYIKQYLSLK